MRNSMSKRIYWLLMASFMSLLAYVGMANAGPHMRDADGMHDRMFDRMAKHLELTEEQQTSVAQLREQFHAQQKPLKERLHATRNELGSLATVGNYDADAVNELADQLGDLTSELAVAHVEFKNQFQLLLNDEQRAKVAEFHQKMGSRMERKAQRMEKKMERMERRQARHEAQGAS